MPSSAATAPRKPRDLLVGETGRRSRTVAARRACGPDRGSPGGCRWPAVEAGAARQRSDRRPRAASPPASADRGWRVAHGVPPQSRNADSQSAISASRVKPPPNSSSRDASSRFSRISACASSRRAASRSPARRASRPRCSRGMREGGVEIDRDPVMLDRVRGGRPRSRGKAPARSGRRH